MGLSRKHSYTGIEEELPLAVSMDQGDQLVAAPPLVLPAVLLGRVHRVVVLIEKKPGRAFAGGVIRHKEIGPIPDEDPLWVEGPVLPQDQKGILIEPQEQSFGVGVPGELTQIILITGIM
ncbi:hypothetical protein HKBW3S43_01127 [Candidatus Hakubella thermalkaliphila]|uniref:Uncharacterized protein n=1 Tax=Candidatus Hakubella thermalkaliphila TaxID=2754717 RepID=A0A6V8P683_9ACTN|nr:hypothetical protein HKBW3S33_01319 [Candidatus Hakubella thermalkaliphila]GFP35335.1 hypothetical protein HKBW3S43_01127 [Candidatus Hakubella thermalkaliphila]